MGVVSYREKIYKDIQFMKEYTAALNKQIKPMFQEPQTESADHIVWYCSRCHYTLRTPIRTVHDITSLIYSGWPLCPDCVQELDFITEDTNE